MCGIAGLVDFERQVDRVLLERLGSALEHRGPDQGGQFVDQQACASIGLASRRLTIIDPSPAGDQPMMDSTGAVWIVYNGELYNHLALRTELRSANYQHRSRSDTETVLHAYEHFGLDCLKRFNGMFAVAIYDRPRSRLILARDRLGIKPLYYWWDGTRLAFASELKALLLCPWIERVVDRNALRFYVSLGYVPSPGCVIAGVKKLLPGSLLVLDLARQEIGEQRYWRPPRREGLPTRRSTPELLQQARSTIEVAVERQLMSDVPVGSFLSGGVDSTLVTGLAQRHHGARLDTFAAGYQQPESDPSFDPACNEDLAFARLVSERFGTRHHEIQVPAGPELADSIVRVVRALDEPLGEATAVVQHLICQVARQHGVVVVLTGDGGDELFAGYPWYPVASRLQLYERVPLLRQVLPLLERWSPAPTFRAKARHLAGRLHAPDVQKYHHFYNVPAPADLARVLSTPTTLHSEADAVADALGARLGERGQVSFAEKIAWIDLSWWIPDMFNQRLDRMSMLNSVEARVPFQDNEVVDLALSIPIERKMPHEHCKYVLHKAFADLLPPEIVRRVKRPFVGPYTWWLRAGLRDLALDSLSEAGLAKTDLVDPTHGRAAAERYCLDAQGDPLFVWRLLMLQLWCREFTVARASRTVA